MDDSLFHILWIIIAGCFVFVMQGGFMCLESGFTRSKNSINVAIKNLTDFAVSFVLFWAVGFGIMFGATQGGWFGSTLFTLPFETAGAWMAAFFFFQAMFAATASTILSGAIAERVRFLGYIIMTILVSGLIYPVSGHWAWNGAEGISEGGWLGTRGFIDFAGSTVVHSVGGWVALAALLIMGSRTGRFARGEKPQDITGHNLPLSVLGALLLFFGWFGFNGGSTLEMNESVAVIIANTSLAGAAGAVAMLAAGWAMRGRPDVELVINGALAGLVAITANCHCVSAVSALLIGAVGGWIALLCDRLLEALWIDDAVGAIPVHLAAGVWGTIAVALLGDLTILDTGLTRFEQLQIQLTGIAMTGAWAFGVAFVVLWLVNKIFPLRISPEEELQGLNIAEHGASTELIDLLGAMERQGRAGDLSMRVPVEPFTEVGQIARHYNKVMDLLQRAVARAESIVRGLQDGIVTFATDGTVTSANPGVEKIFGYALDEMLGRPVTALFAGSDGTATLTLPALLQGDEHETELPARRKTGEPFWAEIQISQGEQEGELTYTGLIKDVTERRLAEDALECSRDRIQKQNEALGKLARMEISKSGDFGLMLQEISETAHSVLGVHRVLIWMFENDTSTLRLRALHPNGGTLEGRAVAISLEGAPNLWESLVQGRSLVVSDTWNDPRVAEFWGLYLNKQRVNALLCATVRTGGEPWGVIFAEVTHSRQWHPEEEQFLASMADYVALSWEEAERRLAEQRVRDANTMLERRVQERTHELQQSNAELKQAMEALKTTQTRLVQSEKMAALGELVAGIAHEINTPVGVALTAASHLEKRTGQFNAEFKDGALKKSSLEAFVTTAGESSRMLLSNLQRASELVQSFKKVAVDQSSEALRPFPLRDYVGEVLLSLRPKLKRLKHTIHVEAPEDLEVNSYPGAFSQVVTNFIMNSIVHAYEDDEAGAIRMTFTRNGGELLFVYSDDGKGIPAENLVRIFDPFFTTKRGRGGSGLGLHLVFNLVTTTLGGTIDAESTPGQGTQFTVRMPLCPASVGNGAFSD